MTKKLSDRQEYILGLLVRTYVETGLPVGSRTLVELYDLEVSAATVRNELSLLDDLGYLIQLHTSGGRAPTEMGYRYFVQRLIGEFELPVDERQMIRHQFHQARLDLNQWMRLAAAVLAHTSRGASIVTAPRPNTNSFKHLQLISTQGRLVLMILVFYGGQVQQQMLTLAEPVPQARLTLVTESLNQMFEDASYDDIYAKQGQLDDALEMDVTRLILDGMSRSDKRAISEFYRDGLVNIVDDEGARQAVRVLEEGTYLANVLAETLETGASGVQVVIGGGEYLNEVSENVENLDPKDLGSLVSEEAPESAEGPLGDEIDQDDDVEKTISELEENLAHAEIQAAEYLDGWQRARAEFSNARKRLERERAEAYGKAAIDYAKKVLPILDDFDRALGNVPESIEQDEWYEGIILVSRKMHSILMDLNVERIEAIGQPFDPNIHEALSLTEAEGFESGTVVEELQIGYRLGNRVIRPTLVNVAA
jgi:heat-inducible transcriptional repressor